MSAILAWALAAASVATPTQREWAELIGFSADGRRAAYRHDVDITNDDGTHDQFTLIQTIDVAHGYPIGAFQIAIHRLDPSGRPLKVKKKVLEAAHERYERAYPSKRWLALKKRERFDAVAVHGEPYLFQVALDENTKAQGGLTEQGIIIAADPGTPLGFTAVAHGRDDQAIEVGTFRRDAAEGDTIVARVTAYRAKKGAGLAVLVIFLVSHGDDVTTMPEVKVTGDTLAALPKVPRTDDPWRMKQSLDAAPKVDAETRRQVPEKERQQLESVYRWFTGNPK